MDKTDYEEIVIGVNEGDLSEMIGSIRDVATDYRGTLFVLDREYNHVRVYDYDGSFISMFGGPGEGPGELLGPQKLLIADQGRTIAVRDGGRAVDIFERQDSTTFRVRSSFATEEAGFAGCAMNGYLYLLGFSHELEGVIHKYTLEGERVASFGAPYKSSNPMIREDLSTRGLLACSEEEGIVAWAREYIPVLTGFTEIGEVAWQVFFADFKSHKIIESQAEDGTPQVMFYRPEVGESIFGTLFTDSSGNYFYVGYTTMVDSANSRLHSKIHLFRVDARTGEGTYLGDAPHVYAVDTNHIITMDNYPFPQVKIYRHKEALN